MEIAHVKNVRQYLRHTMKYRDERGNEIWYRGHNSQKFALEPKMYRSIYGTKSNVAPFDYESAYKEFFDKIKMLGYDITDLNSLHIMAVARHYGLPTPILDWSVNPLSALFFAVDGYKMNNMIHPVVYLLDPCMLNRNSQYINAKTGKQFNEPISIDLNPSDPSLKLFSGSPTTLSNTFTIAALKSNHNYVHRCSRQSGVFTFHGFTNYPWLDYEENGKRLVSSIYIHPGSVKSIVSELEKLGINRETIYGTDPRDVELDSFCEKLAEKYKR